MRSEPSPVAWGRELRASGRYLKLGRGGRLAIDRKKVRLPFQRVPQRIHAHVSIAVLVLPPERMAEQACGQRWRALRDRSKHIQLAELLVDGADGLAGDGAGRGRP